MTDVARASWVVQVHVTTSLPGRIRAWGLHQKSTDHLFVVSGLVTIVVFDGRRDSPTSGRVNELTLSEKNPGLLIIPPNLYHGWKNIGTSEAIIINMPTRMYNYEAPDALDLPWCGSCRPHNTLSLVSPARRDVGADDTTASRSNNRLIWIGSRNSPTG